MLILTLNKSNDVSTFFLKNEIDFFKMYKKVSRTQSPLYKELF